MKKFTVFTATAFVLLALYSNISSAQSASSALPAQAASAPKVVLPPGVTEEMLAPPPVPRFMLEKSDKPLTVDQMVQQAREAELKAGIKPKPQPERPSTPAASTVQ